MEQKISNRESIASILREMEKTREAYRLRHVAADGIRHILNIAGGMDEKFTGDNLEQVKQGTQFWKKLSGLLEYFDDDGQKRLMSKMGNSGTMASVLGTMRESLDIDELQYFDKKKAVYKENIFQILKQARERMDPDGNWGKMIKEEVYFCWLAQIEQKNPILKGTPRGRIPKEEKGSWQN